MKKRKTMKRDDDDDEESDDDCEVLVTLKQTFSCVKNP